MIKVENLLKSFGQKRAVDGVSFEVKRGEVLGFLGPNGAGKSTTMRMVTGFIAPDGGSVSIGGHNVLEDPLPAKRLIGYLPENAPAYTDMSVRGFLGFAAELRGLKGGAKRQSVDRAIETCFLQAVAQQSVDTLSKGYRHRTCLAQALLHDPEVLILDEPTDGLDPNQKHEVRTLIQRMGQTKAIIFSTHILEEVEAMCTRAIIIDRGKIVANGTPSELKGRSGNAGAVTIAVLGQTSAEVQEKLAALPGVSEVSLLSESGGRVVLRLRGDHSGDKTASATGAGNASLALSVSELARAQGWLLQSLQTEEGRLDEVFRTITQPDAPGANR